MILFKCDKCDVQFAMNVPRYQVRGEIRFMIPPDLRDQLLQVLPGNMSRAHEDFFLDLCPKHFQEFEEAYKQEEDMSFRILGARRVPPPKGAL